MSKDTGGIRNQFHHVIDIVPTIREATGVKAPDVVNGVAQKPSAPPYYSYPALYRASNQAAIVV